MNRAELREALRERTALKFVGSCKCGHCQLVPQSLIGRIVDELGNAPRDRAVVIREWHRAVQEFGLAPGSQVETVVSRILGGLGATDPLAAAVTKFLDGRMAGFPDSRFVDDDLVALAYALCQAEGTVS